MNIPLEEEFDAKVRQRTRGKGSMEAKIEAIRELFLEYPLEQRKVLARYGVSRHFLSGSLIHFAFSGTWEEGGQEDWNGWPPFMEAFDVPHTQRTHETTTRSEEE